MTMTTITVNGSQVLYVAGTLQVDMAVGKRSTANFASYNRTDTHFQQYQQVAIYNATSALIFSGYITSPSETKPGFQHSLLTTITCCDQHFLADKRKIAAAYQNWTPAQIATDIATTILAEEGVTIGMIYDPNPALFVSPSTIVSTSLLVQMSSSAIANAQFNYCSVADALDALVTAASSSGIPYYWQIDQYKQLWFVPYTFIGGPATDGTLIDNGRLSGTAPSVTRANPMYRNSQYILGGVAQTLPQDEFRNGDDVTQSWAMGYALASMPTVSVNLDGAGFVAQTVGIKGSSGSQFYWSQADPTITQDPSGAILRGADNGLDVLQVQYTGQYPVVISTANASQVAYQAMLDGTSGIIDEVETDPSVNSIPGGLAEANNFLTRYGVQGIQFVFSTLSTSYVQGQLITVTYSPFGFYGVQMLVEEVAFSDQQDGLNLWYTVTAIVGPYDTDWQSFFRAILTPTPPADVSVGMGQSVNILASFTATSSPAAASFTATTCACPLVSSSTLCSTSTIVC